MSQIPGSQPAVSETVVSASVASVVSVDADVMVAVVVDGVVLELPDVPDVDSSSTPVGGGRQPAPTSTVAAKTSLGAWCDHDAAVRGVGLAGVRLGGFGVLVSVAMLRL